MEARAVMRYVRVTPRKLRRVVDLIRGKTAAEAVTALKMMPYRGSVPVAKLLRSAMANAEQKNVVSPEEMKIVGAYVDEGPVMKRLRPRAMGRANVIKKKSSHITLVLSE